MAIVIQFFFSFVLMMKSFEYKFGKVHEEYNRAALMLEVDEERQKLIK
jgi:ABC-type sulfate transport system permease component